MLLPPGWEVAPLPFFPPQAIILSVLLLTPARRWWIILAVYYVMQVVQGITLGGLPLWYSLLSNGANVLEPLVGAALFRRFVPQSAQFTNLEVVAVYFACVTLASVLGASWGAASRVLAGAPFWQSWQGWFLADVLASLVLAPMIILWATAGHERLGTYSRARWGEAACLGVGLLLVGWLVFGSRPEDADRAPALLYLPVPLLVWAAVRFGPRVLMTALALVTALAVAGASSELGPFASRTTAANVFTLQLFLLGIGVPLFCLAMLVRERRQTEHRLEGSEERYRAVVTNLPHGAVLLYGPELRHVFADGQGLPEVGLSKDAIEGKTLQDSFPAPMASVLEPHYRAALAGSHDSFELTHAGRIYHVEVLPVTSADAPTGMVLLQDVTEERRAEALAVANAELARLNRAKSDFVSVVSHEFRTPLTGIQAFSELIRDEEFPVDEIKVFAADINREAERLGRMISELLDLDRMESGQMTLRVEPLDLNALIAEAVAGIGPNAPQHALRLELDATLPSLPGDRDKMTQVILNLLSNAIKYSPKGGNVTVGTTWDRARAHLWVRDQGVGIPSDALEAVFERYTRLETGANSMIQGTGLGLPIVRQIAELHGGRAWAESEVGRGSTFHVTLPLTGATKAA
jgi:signal transduction histidine kinase/integral membrane sensor domain MASE1